MTSPLTLKALAARWFARKSTCLGEDVRTVQTLKLVLADLGALRVDEQWGVAGAVELIVTTVEIGSRRLIVEQETYSGVTIRGDRDQLVRARLAAT